MSKLWRKLPPLFELLELRTYLLETWYALPERLPNAALDEFIIMSDHVHGIIWLNGEKKEEHIPTLGRVIGAYKSLTTVA